MTSALAQAKINLVFQVAGLGEDGYHEVRSIYQALELQERVTVSKSDSWQVEVLGDVPGIENAPRDQSNIVVRAAVALATAAGISNPQPMRFVIEKQIPVEGGMAGGSADAAAALVALNEAWCLGLSERELLRVGATLGADVPFALFGGTAFGTGTGTELERLQSLDTHFVLLVFSPSGLSTKAVFEEFDRIRPAGDQLDLDAENYLHRLGENSLSAAALSLMPSLESVMRVDCGIPGGFISGSGPTVWFTDKNEEKVMAAQKIFQALGYKTLVTKTSPFGARLD